MKLVGYLSRVQFHRDTFVIAQLRVDGVAEEDGAGSAGVSNPAPAGAAVMIDVAEATIKGTMIAPQIGALYTLEGEWETHARFGRQFAFASYEISYPSRAEDVISYLTELPGIGPRRAAAIVAAFGAEGAADEAGSNGDGARAAIVALRERPREVAAAVKGFTLADAERAAAQLRDQEAIEAALLEVKHLLGGTAIGRPAIKRIVERWGKNAPDEIRADPYILAREIHGVGFRSSDQVARRLPAPHTVQLDSPSRIAAGLAHVLESCAADGGHTCVPVRALAALGAELLGIDDEVIIGHLAESHDRGEIQVTVEAHEPDPPAGGHAYLPALLRAECEVARDLGALIAWSAPTDPTPPTPALAGLHEDQIEAVTRACASRVLLLTGAPGTGKTHTLRAILETFRGRRIALCAPTGKAAKRMTEATGAVASTIHSLLRPAEGGPQGDVWKFQRGRDAPLDVDMLVCDEVSMLDVRLARDLIAALRPGTRLLFVGDSHQLPSVGPGNVLADLVAAGVVPHVELLTIKRQDPGLIVTNCHKIKDGKALTWPEPTHPEAAGSDFLFRELPDATPEAVAAEVVELVAHTVWERLEISTAHEALRAIQVISPLRERTALGCDALNLLLQDRLNPASEEVLAPPGASWGRSAALRLNDKIIQTRNDYQLGAINGDVGYLREWLPMGERGGDGRAALRVRFDAPERDLVVPAAKNDLELAYALTCHKFQGSEAPCIVIPMHRCFGGLIVQRNWIYTAISRAKKLCVVVGQPKALRDGVRRTAQTRRCSRLAAHLRRAIKDHVEAAPA